MIAGGGSRPGGSAADEREEDANDMEWETYPPEDGLEHTVTGTVRILREVQSPELENVRDLLAYLPPSYGTGERRYPVIYMHDGQNLFDQATSFGDEWRVDETMQEVAVGGVEAIVIGVPNMGPERCEEYSPFVDPAQGGGCGDEYLDFVVRTVKPLVDADFRTLPEREHTGIVGSSMGGLISLYGFFREPGTFGFAGVMSPRSGSRSGPSSPSSSRRPRARGASTWTWGRRRGSPPSPTPGGCATCWRARGTRRTTPSATWRTKARATPSPRGPSASPRRSDT
jgi:enterochelin esterase-like enzyme